MTPWLLSIVVAVAIALVVAEVKGGLHALAQAIAARAARTLPEAHSERWREEWASDLDSYADRPLSALWRAGKFRRDAREMRRDLLGMPTHGRSSVAIKRGLDVAVAGIGLLFFAPLLMILMLAIKIDSRGPATYRAVRVGRFGQPFHLVKLRTMAVDVRPRPLAPEAGAAWALWDPHVTRVGRVARQLRVDHLPMLVNVLRGDMSLVGPSPAIPPEVDDDLQDYERPGPVRPGMTGLSQLADLETFDLTYGERRLMDEEYAHSWSVRGDLKIIALTMLRMLTGR